LGVLQAEFLGVSIGDTQRDVKGAIGPNKPGVNYFTLSKSHGRFDRRDLRDAIITNVPFPYIILFAPTCATTLEGTREPGVVAGQ
jgi:hypothetical protein